MPGCMVVLLLYAACAAAFCLLVFFRDDAAVAVVTGRTLPWWELNICITNWVAVIDHLGWAALPGFLLAGVMYVNIMHISMSADG